MLVPAPLQVLAQVQARMAASVQLALVQLLVLRLQQLARYQLVRHAACIGGIDLFRSLVAASACSGSTTYILSSRTDSYVPSRVVKFQRERASPRCVAGRRTCKLLSVRWRNLCVPMHSLPDVH